MKTVLAAILVVSILALGLSNTAYAQLQAGGVNKEGSWFVGEGLKKGDYFSYNVCHIYYKDCTPFKIEFWVEGDEKVGSETQWHLQVLVKESGKTIRGTINLGKIAAEPIGSTKNLIPHAAAFKSSFSWLSAYATGDIEDVTGKGPKKFNMPSWGRIGNIGGEQIIPASEEKVAVPDGVYDTVRITWKTGGKINNVWIVDNFPFPVKADTYAHVSSGVPPQEYRFELLDFQRDVKTNPLPDADGKDDGIGKDCPRPSNEFAQVSKNTNTNTMIIDIKYTPKSPKQGCTMDFVIDFKRKVNQEEYENEVHYDILVVKATSAGTDVIRSLAGEEKRNAFFTTSGQVRTTINVKESGKTTYAILVKGTGPEVAPDALKAGFMTFDVDVMAGSGTTTTPPTPPKTETIVIPSWIKTNAKFWSDGQITDKDFVSGIQYLINQKIIKIPSTSASGAKSDTIPSWVKDAAKFWADGQTTDKDFVNGIQYLITNGIIKLKS